jgi:negative regulator of sigma E activity
MFSTGAMSVYKRIVGEYGLILVGEVPPQTLKKLGDGIEPGKGQ